MFRPDDRNALTSSRPSPTRLAIAGLLALSTLLGAGCSLPTAEASFEQVIQPVGDTTWVKSMNAAGETCVLAGEGPSIVVRGRVRARNLRPETAARAARAFAAQPSFTYANGVLELSEPDLAAACGADCRGLGQTGVDGTVDWEIEVPASASATLVSKSGRVCASGLSGIVSLRSASGDVVASEIAGHLTAVSDSGNVFVHGAEAVEVLTHDGSVRATGIRGPAGLTTAAGDVSIEDAGADLAVETDSGDVVVRSALGRDATWSLVTGSGHIEGALPATQGFRVEFHTLTGRLLSDFELDDRPRLVGGSVGDPAGLIHARTVSGDLRLARDATR